MIETEGIPRLNSTSHEWVKHPTRLIARFPGARLKNKKADNLLFGPSAARILSKRLPAASNWIGFSYSRLRAPFWTVCGPYPSKRLPAASNWIGFSYSRLQAPFWTVCGPYPSKGFRQPRTGPLHTSGYLFQAVTAWILQNGLCGSPTGSALSVSSRGLIF